MEPPVIPLYSRSRLIRDYTSEEEVPRVTYSRSNARRERDYDLPSPSRADSLEAKSDDGRKNSFRSYGARSPQTLRDSITPWQNGTSETLPSPNQQEDLRKLDFNLDAIDEQVVEKSYDAPSISSMSRVSQHTGISGSSSSKMPDFFANEVFHIVLRNPATAHRLLKFSQSRLCGENIEFLERVDRYNTLLNDVAKTMFEIHKDFISTDAPNQVNIPAPILAKANQDLKTSLSSVLPRLESVFLDAQNDVERLVSSDIYPRFVRHQMTTSTARALASNRGKYAGLGDCFVLTDPAKADNPIVYASDGFVKVTGYSRNEIIPRNCRFLQNRHTDKSAVSRLRDAIYKRKESVELLLNQKKNGEPFWNLLYTAPLFDTAGDVVFFLGGQINCSTSIHNASDIIRILASSDDVDEDREPTPVQPEAAKASRGSRILSAFRTNSRSNIQQRAPGMENGLVNRMERMNLKTQMDTFYTTYSKFIIVNYSTFFITFHSSGIIELLYPVDPRSQYQKHVVGTDIFKFLANHASGSLTRDFKSRVKAALKVGQPISLDVTLCTRRYMGFEKFIVHWTPLKNDTGEVGWVVLTLSEQGG
ncbi:hypothetical protein LTR66_006049 [Elasticomyces elasticus]|nr:hypothetical protein LTR66_006049 [Elasticomyces elasticus]